MQEINDELFACANNSEPVSRIECLVTRYQIDINDCWKGEYSLLMVAANSGNVETVRRLIKLGANVNATSKTGYTALMEAAKWNQLTMIELLIDFGAASDARDKHGRTARTIAIQNGNLDVLPLLHGIPTQKKTTKAPKRRFHNFTLHMIPSAPPSPVPSLSDEPDSPCSCCSVSAAVLSDVAFVPVVLVQEGGCAGGGENMGECGGESKCEGTVERVSGGESKCEVVGEVRCESKCDGDNEWEEVHVVEDLIQFGMDVVEILNPTAAAVSPSSPQLLPLPTPEPFTHAHAHSWLHRRLSTQELAPHLIELCEAKLVYQEGFTSETLFARIPPDGLTHEHLRQVGIEPLAARFMVLSLHKHIRDTNGFVWE